jgi:penicillin-binding protein 2
VKIQNYGPSLVHTERYSKDILLVQDLSFEQLSQLEEQLAAADNIKIETTFKRHYPHHKTACHIIGYLGNMDAQTLGKMGLEKICEEDLKGLEGSRLRTINSFGTSLAETEMSKRLAGKNINNTIDFTLQTIADSIFPDNQSGVIILMDPRTVPLKHLFQGPISTRSSFYIALLKKNGSRCKKNNRFLIGHLMPVTHRDHIQDYYHVRSP